MNRKEYISTRKKEREKKGEEWRKTESQWLYNTSQSQHASANQKKKSHEISPSLIIIMKKESSTDRSHTLQFLCNKLPKKKKKKKRGPGGGTRQSHARTLKHTISILENHKISNKDKQPPLIPSNLHKPTKKIYLFPFFFAPTT